MDKSTMDATQDRSMKEKLMGIVGTFMNSLWIVWLMIVIKNLIVDALSRKFKFNFVFTVGDGIAIILITSIVVFTVHLVERFILVKEENNEALLLREWASLSGTLATVILLGIYFNNVIFKIPLLIAGAIAFILFTLSKRINARIY